MCFFPELLVAFAASGRLISSLKIGIGDRRLGIGEEIFILMLCAPVHGSLAPKRLNPQKVNKEHKISH